MFLKKRESFTANKIAIGMEPMNHGRVLFFAFSDGSVEYRDRMDMSETFNDGNLERVWHLAQIGFTYPEDEPCGFSVSHFMVVANLCRPAGCILPKFLLCCAIEERRESPMAAIRLPIGGSWHKYGRS